MIKIFDNLQKINYIKNFFFNYYNIKNFNDFNINNFKDLIIKRYCFKNSYCNCYIEITPLIGGIDAYDLSSLLYNFYFKWFFKKKIQIEIFNENFNKKIIFVKDKFSFSFIRRENGIHRIIRKNPLLSSTKIQTSFINFNIIPKTIENFFLNENDLIFDYFKAKGTGGQHVNTTDSSVRITHKPTNTIIICQSERSQIKNKLTAIKIIEYKLYLKKNISKNYYLNCFKSDKKYIKTYNFINNELIDHISDIKYNLTNFFNNFLDFLIL